MKNFKNALTMLVFLFIAISCNKDDSEEKPKKVIEGAIEIEVSVKLPEGSNLDLTTTEIVSIGESYKVPASGKTKIYVAPNNRSFVSLQDKTGEVIFMGFITNEDKELSIASSGKAALYFALGTVFQFEQTKEKYFNEYNAQKEIISFNEAITPLFLADKQFLKNEPFKNLVKNTMEELTVPKEFGSKTNKVKDVIVEDTGEKSGIKITNEGPLSIGFQSQSRRRTYAFIYKTASKPLNSTSFSSVPRQLVNQAELLRSDGFTSTLGTFWTGATGKGQDLYIKDTPAVSLPLLDTESAAKFEVRVIGLSCQGNPTEGMSEEEKKKYNDMQMDYFVYDLILPTLGTALGAKSFDSAKQELFKTAVVSALGSSATEEVFKGNFKKASTDFIEQFTKGNLTTGLENVLETAVQVSDLNNIEGASATAKVFKPLAIIDALLQLNDFLRLQAAACTSNAVETWEVIASRSTNINLLPKESVIRPGDSQTLELKISSDGQLGSGQNYEMDWITSGNYGSLSGSLTLSNSSKTVVYVSNASINQDAEDTVAVQLYIKDKNTGNRTLLGKDSTIVKIAKNKYKIVPEEPFLKGGQFVNLSLVDFEGKPIPNPSSGNYKVEWTTSGKYGKYDGITNYYNSENQNQGPTYECLDKNTKVGVENVTANIYYYKSDADKTLIDKVEGIININNDPNFLILPIVVKEFTTPIPSPSACPSSLEIDAGVLVPKIKGNVTYELTFGVLTLNGGNSTVGPQSRTWTNDNYDSYYIYDYDANYYFVWQAGAGLCSTNPDVGKTRKFYSGAYGEATVNIIFN